MHHCSDPTVQVLHENQSNFKLDSLDYELALMDCNWGSPRMLASLTLTPEIIGWMLWEKNTGKSAVC